MKNNKMIFGILVSFVFLATIGFTYAFFSITINVQGEVKNVETSTGTLNILYTDGNVINAESIEPGWTLTKTFTVKNTGSLKAFYSIDWFSLTNTITNDELVMSATCVQTLDGNVSGMCEGLTEIPIATSLGKIKGNIGINPGYIHTYTLTFNFQEISALQNYNQGKTFAGVLHINSSEEAFTLKGTLLDSSSSPVANATIEVHSNIRTAVTDSDGKFTIEGVEVGSHTISVKDSSNSPLATDSMSLLSGDETTVTDKNITANKDNSVVLVEIQLGTSNINTITSKKTTLTNIMLVDNTAYADNESSPYVTSATGIDFSNVNSDTNGKGLYYTANPSKTEDGTRVYYYRGDVTNNYVIFGGFCWKIIRTNEDGSTKLFYWGTPTNNTCSIVASKILSLSSTRFNQTYGDNTYAGYMMGLENQCTNDITCTGTNNTTSLSQAQSNTYSSNIKLAVDDWYSTNILNQGTSVTNLIANTPYCNDMSITSGDGYGTSTTYYGAYTRLSTNKNPQYKCPQNDDKFTLSVASGGTSEYGNNKLTYPVGLITADEAAYAGEKHYATNTSYYLYINSSYLTMSPFFWNSGNAYIWGISSNGILGSALVYGNVGAFPVISLKSNAQVSTGTGTNISPYIISTN